MKKTIALLAATALLAACGQKDIDPDDVRQALPKAAQVQLQTASSDPAGALSAPNLGEPAEYAAASFWTAFTFNVATAWTLTVVQFITSLPPTECDADACTWGPWTDEETAAVWKLDVTRNGDGYDWVLAAHAADSQTFLSVIEGTAFSGGMPGRGYGDLTLNFDNGRAVNPASDDHGVLDVSYDNRASLQIDALFLGARNDDPENDASEFLDIAYRFGESAAGGELQIAFETVDGPEKNLSLRTRWTVGGQGRGDARYSEGGTAYEGSQCWLGESAGAEAWLATYERFAFGVTEVESGSLASCGLYSSPLFSNLVLP